MTKMWLLIVYTGHYINSKYRNNISMSRSLITLQKSIGQRSLTWTIFTQLININLINITVIQSGVRCGGFSMNAYIVSLKQMFVHTFTNQYWPMLGVGGYNRGPVKWLAGLHNPALLILPLNKLTKVIDIQFQNSLNTAI